MKIRKISMGIRFQKRMMRLGSLSGVVMDHVVETFSEKQKDGELFTRFERNPDGLRLKLMDADDTRQLLIDPSQVIFVHDDYEKEDGVNVERFQVDFGKVFESANQVLKFSDARRIGIVAEYRQADASPSSHLLSCLTKLPSEGVPAKFVLQFERRYVPTTKVGTLDVSTDDFINVIETFYDAEVDSSHPDTGSFNLTLDVQRYYNPIVRSDFLKEAMGVFKEFRRRERDFSERIRGLKLVNE